MVFLKTVSQLHSGVNILRAKEESTAWSFQGKQIYSVLSWRPKEQESGLRTLPLLMKSTLVKQCICFKLWDPCFYHSRIHQRAIDISSTNTARDECYQKNQQINNVVMTKARMEFLKRHSTYWCYWTRFCAVVNPFNFCALKLICPKSLQEKEKKKLFFFWTWVERE